MFHTFNVAEGNTKPRQDRDASTRDVDSTPRKRPKVTTACDRCRLFRVKCGEKPCAQCIANKARCVTSNNGSARQKAKSKSVSRSESTASSPASKTRNDISLFLDVTKPTLTTAAPTPTSSNSTLPLSHGSVTSTGFGLEEYYGLDRPTFFYARIDAFFAGQQSTDQQASSRTSRSSPADSGSSPDCGLGPFPTLPHPTAPQTSSANKRHLSADQQAYFLQLFWEAYYPLLQIPNECDFRRLHESLWHHAAPKEQALTGALVDCMTALGVQYGYGADLASRILSLRDVEPQHKGDVSWAGFEYFRSCRDALYTASDQEYTLEAMQCQVLAILYLMNASHFRDAYNMLGTAIRNAHGANLHREPPEHIPLNEKNLRRRLWWLLFMLDIRCSNQLGRPVAVQPSVISCNLPDSDNGGSSNTSWRGLSVSAYFTHAVKLAIVRADIDRLISTTDIYEPASNITTLEQRASMLASALVYLEKWRLEIPSDLLNARRDSNANPFSIAESPVILEPGLPAWLHRQRVLLEVHYHNAYIMLQRPYICFPRALNLSHIQQPQTDQHARSSLQHAIVMTIIVHGVCSMSDALYGWPEILQPLWNATVTMFAFVLANPLCTRAPGARLSICRALSVFEAFATTSSLAKRAQEITLSLKSRLDQILGKLEEGARQRNGSIMTISTISTQQSPAISSDPVLTDNETQSSSGDVIAEALELGWDTTIPFPDNSLCSWVDTLDYKTWQGYQTGLEDFLVSPTDGFPLDSFQFLEPLPMEE